MQKNYLELNARKAAYVVLGIYCLIFSLSIALSQIVLVVFLFLVLSAVFYAQGKSSKGVAAYFVQVVQSNYDIFRIFYFPALCWFAITFVSLVFGLDVKHSSVEFLKFSIYFILPILIFALFSLEKDAFSSKQFTIVKKYFYLLFGGQSLAACHTVVSGALGHEIRPAIPGPLTESGQIAFLLPLYFAIVIDFFRNNNFHKLYFIKFFCFSSIILNLIAWKFFLPNHKQFLMPILLIVLGIVYLLGFKTRKTQSSKAALLLSIAGSLMILALLVNLKRGPWVSVVFSTLVFASLYSLRGLVFAGLSVFGLCLLPPIWQRLSTFQDHFFIGGGRFDMWKLGFQLIETFPLGIGFSNSNMIRKFDSDLPEMHRHMHNNILNVTLENGILSGVLYCWWFYFIVTESIRFLNRFRNTQSIISGNIGVLCSLAITLAIVGYQIAGIVEYNFGDGEIRLLFLVLFGFQLVLFKSIKNSSSVTYE